MAADRVPRFMSLAPVSRIFTTLQLIQNDARVASKDTRREHSQFAVVGMNFCTRLPSPISPT
jgi:hypothetical protein